MVVVNVIMCIWRFRSYYPIPTTSSAAYNNSVQKNIIHFSIFVKHDADSHCSIPLLLSPKVGRGDDIRLIQQDRSKLAIFGRLNLVTKKLHTILCAQSHWLEPPKLQAQFAA